MHALIVAILLAGAAASQQPSSSKGGPSAEIERNSSSRNDTAEQHKDTTAHAITAINQTPPARVERKPDSQSGNQFREASSNWWEKPDWWLVVFTGLLAGITGALAIYTGKLWGATKALAEDAKRTAKAQLRAYVGVANSAHEFGPILHLFRVTWKNQGVTPARNVKSFINAKAFDTAIPSEFDFADYVGDDEKETYTNISANTEYITVPASFSSVEVAGSFNGTKFLYLYGWIEYNDTLGSSERWRTEFCSQIVIRQINAGFDSIKIDHSDYNGMDSDCKYKPGQTPKREKPGTIMVATMVSESP